ncbi:synaphin protein domain-containing protein [Ditylenchus destructor]|uniref:Putative complexin-1 n=1 Tax=Ditylenchus destructor TaxID=166010 RepID=A0AAD4MRR7_9BILA|nr:synaphin protein domain-containing protein [Ditylenchus destructor]
MASFVMKQVVGSKINEVTGGLNKMGGDDGGEKEQQGEDPEVIAARKEQEEKRKDKHRKMEQEREKMRSDIRNKYNIQKKEDGMAIPGMMDDGRVGSARKKTPEELAQEMNAANEDSLIGQLGLTEQVEQAKAAANKAFETVRGFLPFGK